MSKREQTNSMTVGAPEGRNPGPKWTQEEAIACECACDYLGEVLGIYSSELDSEEAREAPREDRVAWLEAEIVRLARVRRQLRVTDHETIAEIRRVFGALLRRQQ